MCNHALSDAPGSLLCCRESGHAHGHVYLATSQPDTKHADTASLEDA